MMTRRNRPARSEKQFRPPTLQSHVASAHILVSLRPGAGSERRNSERNLSRAMSWYFVPRNSVRCRDAVDKKEVPGNTHGGIPEKSPW